MNKIENIKWQEVSANTNRLRCLSEYILQLAIDKESPANEPGDLLDHLRNIDSINLLLVKIEMQIHAIDEAKK